MVQVNSVSSARAISVSVEKPHPHRLTLLFGLMVGSCCIIAIGIFLYRWIHRSFEDLGNQALDRKDFQKAADCFTRWLNAPASDAINEKRLQRLIQNCEKALASLNLEVQSRARFLILRGEANLGLNKPAEALQDLTAVLELGLENLNSDNLSRLIQGCEKVLLCPNFEFQSRAGVHVIKGQANLVLNKPSEAFQEFKNALGLLFLYLKSYKFSEVIQCCDVALKSDQLDDQLKAQFWMLKGLAYLGLNNLAEAKQCFIKAVEDAPAESKILALVYYFLGLVSKENGEDFYAGEWCDKALAELSVQDKELKTEVLTLKALSLLDRKQYPDAIENADFALNLCSARTDQAVKEIKVALYFCLASSHCAQKNYSNGFSHFTEALQNIENDPFLRAYILSCRGYYHRTAAFERHAQANLSQAKKDFLEASGCKSDESRDRSELLRCMMSPMFVNLKPNETPVTRLADIIGEAQKANSLPEPQE